MGTYLFRWAAPAKEVIVTGTFDNWAKTIQLTRDRSLFSKLVDLPSADEKIYYKFFVDGNWKLDPSSPIENDHHGNDNNVLRPEDITRTAAKDQTFGVAPIPATPGIGNPVQLAPGEKVPNSRDITANTVESSIKTDKASYESGASAVPGASSAPSQHIVIQSSGPFSSAAAKAGEVPKEPLQHVVIQSSGPFSSTAALAGQVPKEASSAEAPSTSSNTGIIAGGVVGGAALLGAGAAVTYAATKSDDPSTSAAPAAPSAEPSAGSAVSYAAKSADGTSTSGVPSAAPARSVDGATTTAPTATAPSATAPSATAPTATAPTATAPTATAPGTSATSNDSKISTAALATGGVAAVGATVAAGAVAYSMHDKPSSRINDPSDIPSSDPNIMIADEDTMPAIAVANRTADPPSTTVNAAGETVSRDAPTQQGVPVNQGGVEAFRSDPVSADPRSVAAAFSNDPISALPYGAATSSARDPRTVAPAFANDPISALPYATAVPATAAAPTTPAKAVDNKPFSAANRERELSRDISPHSQKPVAGGGVDRTDMAQATPSKSANSPANAAATSSAAKEKKSKRRSFIAKLKDSFKPKPGQTQNANHP